MLGAQAEPDYGMDKRYDSYGSDYDSYGNDDYGKDSYDKRPYGNDDYGKDSYDKKPYGNDDYGKDSYDKKPYESTYGNSYGQDYPSYKPVYNKDPYGKDRDHDKSKDSSSSVSIKKLKCNNINVNLNSIDVSIGSPPPSNGPIDDTNGAAVAAQGGETLAASGLMNDGRDGKKVIVDKENNFAFVCINNNNNAGANQTDDNEKDPCEDCFAQNLNATSFQNVTRALAEGIQITLGAPVAVPSVTIDSFAELCELIEDNPRLISTILSQVLAAAGLEDLDDATFFALVECIAEALDIPIPPV
jgi:hypothetical protein